VDGGAVCSAADYSSCVLHTPTSEPGCVRPPGYNPLAVAEAVGPPTLIARLHGSSVVSPLTPTPVKGPKKRGGKCKAVQPKRKTTQKSAAPLIHPPGRKGLGVIQSPPSDSPQKRAFSSLPASQIALPAADPSPVDIADKPLASVDSLISQTPVKKSKKGGRKSKAELLMMKMAEELEAQTQVDSRQSDSENVEVELTQSGRPRRRAAKTAMKYFQDIADEWATFGRSSPPKAEKMMLEETGKKRRRKRKANDSDDDVDFVVPADVLQQEREEEEEEEDEDALSEEVSDSNLNLFRTSVFAPGEKAYPLVRGIADNGLHNSIMAPVWSCMQTTMDLREAQYSDWEYPEWIPQKDSWHFLSRSEAELYLPLQTTSPPFCIRREGIEEDSDPRVLGRFQSLPPHPQRFDGTFFVGGPVWALDWCPTICGSASCQYVALYCHRGMDDRHRLDVVHTGPALLQLWRLGALSPDKGGDSAASFSYGLAVDDGCVWDLKFCPSGGWELPGTPRKDTEMARLGLLAAAFSSGHVQIYSLPHPESLHSHRRTQGKGRYRPPIC
ncbi:transcription by RNA polymerase III, partial [Pristimantis euphronides]